MGPAQLQLQARARAIMDRLVKEVAHYPDDGIRQLEMFKMFSREASALSHKLGKKIPPDHPKRKAVQHLNEEIEEAIKDLEKNQGRLSLASMLKKIKLLEQLNPGSISPAQINEIKKALKLLIHKIRDEDYRRFQMMLDDEQEAKKLVAELIDMDRKYYAQSKKFREELEGYFVSVYKEAMEIARLQAIVESLQRQLDLINAQIEGLKGEVAEADEYLKKAAEKLAEIEEKNKHEAEHIAELEKQKAKITQDTAVLAQRAQQNDSRLEERWMARHRGEKQQEPRLSRRELHEFAKRHHIKYAEIRRAVREGTFRELYNRYEGKAPPAATPAQPPIELAGAPVADAEAQRTTDEGREALRGTTEELRVRQMEATVLDLDAEPDPEIEQIFDEGVGIANHQRECAAASASLDRGITASRGSIDNNNAEAARTRAGAATVAERMERNRASIEALTVRRDAITDNLKGAQATLQAACNSASASPPGAAASPPPPEPERTENGPGSAMSFD